MGSAPVHRLSALLKDVSRSFYLTLRVLPGSIRPQIGLAYLLARATDTVADTDALPQDERLAALAAIKARICGGATKPLCLERLAGRQASAAERILLNRLEEAVRVLEDVDSGDRTLIQDVLATIISGQSLDLERFAKAGPERIVALENDEQLDDYTYRVAGCVGEFWTKMCLAHPLTGSRLDREFLLSNGIRFGKGLQLVNVLRDVPADLRLGRCYLPRLGLREAGLAPADLVQPSNEARLRPVYLRYLSLAEAHLRAGWAYTNHLPWRHVRLRLACAWPVLIGARTLAKLRTGQVLEPGHRIKISRTEVRDVLFRSVLFYPFPSRWEGLLAGSGAGRRKPLPEPASLDT